MDAERLTPPSPTLKDLHDLIELAAARFSAYGEDRAEAILDTLLWIAAGGERPCLAPHAHIDRERH